MALKEVGGLWKKTDKHGKTYSSGQIEINGKKLTIMVFPNKGKKEDKHPDAQIFVPVDDEEEQPEPSDDLPF